MSRSYISQVLRRQVRERAGFRCEYCLLHEDDATISHEVDHVIAEKHARFFNPRTDLWDQHFQLMGELIVPVSAIGEATERIFLFNIPERCEERWGLQVLDRYPTN